VQQVRSAPGRMIYLDQKRCESAHVLIHGVFESENRALFVALVNRQGTMAGHDTQITGRSARNHLKL
jgi:hypothetical protein